MSPLNQKPSLPPPLPLECGDLSLPDGDRIEAVFYTLPLRHELRGWDSSLVPTSKKALISCTSEWLLLSHPMISSPNGCIIAVDLGDA